jgi:hypothetical protein
MKKLILSVIALIGFGQFESKAQTKSERFDYKIEIGSDAIQLKPGSNAQVDLNLIRGGRYKNHPATLGLSSALPAGITVQYEPAVNVLEKSLITIASAKETKPGVYYVGIKATILNTIKSTLLKVEVKEGLAESAVTSVNE